MNTLRRSLIFSYISKYITTATQLVTSIVLARLLTPEEIGIYTVAAVFVGLGYLLREFGINSYIIQEKELTRDRIRAALTLNLLFGWSIALILFIAKEPLALFYENDAIQSVIGLLCINFLLIPLGAITFAHIRREMRFHHTLVIQVTSALVSAIVAISSAYAGESYLSLVWSSIAGTTTSILMTFVYRSPDLPFLPGLKEVRHVLSYCKYAGTSDILTHIGTTSPDWILGKTLGMHDVGIFSRAAGTLNMFNNAFMHAIWGVTLPHFSKQHREGGIDIHQYLRFVSNITAISWPFMITLVILAGPVVMVLFGNQWTESVPIIQILCVGSLFIYSTSIVNDLLISTGKIGKSFKINATIQLLLISSVLISSTHNLIAVALAIAICNIISFLIYQKVSLDVLGTTLGRFMPVYIKSAALLLICALLPLSCVFMLGYDKITNVISIAAIYLANILIWVLSVIALKLPISSELISAYKRLSKQRREGHEK